MNENIFKKLISQEESEILEFKVNNEDPERIGKYVSALANSSAILTRQASYLIWGVTDERNIVGTTFKPMAKKVGGEPFISWLEKNLDPRIVITFHELNVENLDVVILVIQMNAGRPVAFKGKKYIRSGSSVKDLAGYPEKERELWRSFNARTFEREFAKTNCKSQDIFNLLETTTYLRMLGYPIDSSEEKILEFMESDCIIEKSQEVYNITNLGAYTFARDLSLFDKLSNKSIRVIRYRGKNKMIATFDKSANMGVAVGFENLLTIIGNLLPTKEEYYEKNGQRVIPNDYPPLAIREAVANQIVHQDFSVVGARPMIEIFDNRIDITNPGAPINEPNRLLDLPPLSRNEELAKLFLKMNLVESRGGGIDKIILTLEENNLPAFDIIAKENNTVVTFFEKKNFFEMNDRDCINALYYHAAILYIENDFMTVRTLLKRFDLSESDVPLVMQRIELAVSSGLIKVYNSGTDPQFRSYVPYWGRKFDE